MALILILVLGSIGVSLAQIPITCKRISPCICRDQNGRFVDLRPLARNDGTARYPDVPIYGGTEPSKTVFSFNPCYGFSEGPSDSACKDVAVCQSLNGTSDFLDLGDQRSARFSHFDNGNLSIVYTSKDKFHYTVLSLYCAEEKGDREFYVQGDLGNNMTLTLTPACDELQYCDTDGMKEHLVHTYFLNRASIRMDKNVAGSGKVRENVHYCLPPVILNVAQNFEEKFNSESTSPWLQLWTKYACPRNESEIDKYEIGNTISETTAKSQPETELFTAPPAPHVVTMTAPPSTVSLIVLLLLAILVCVALILAVLMGSVMIRTTRRRLFRNTIVYQPVPTEPQAYYDKSLGIIL